MFQRHGGLSLRVQGKSCGFGVGVLFVAPAPFFVCFAVFPVGETQIWPGDLRVVAAVVCFPCWFMICRETMKPRCFRMFSICLLASPNVRTEPQSEIGRNRGKKRSISNIVRHFFI